MERKLNDSPGRARGQASARRCSESSRVSSGPARRRFPDHPPVCLAVTRPVAFGELPLPDRESRLMRYAPGLCAAFFIALCAASTAAATDLLITDARVYPAPGVAPVENGAVLVRDDRIVAVGPASQIGAGEDAVVIDADGGTVLAGFWNSHVHFTEQIGRAHV